MGYEKVDGYSGLVGFFVVLCGTLILSLLSFGLVGWGLSSAVPSFWCFRFDAVGVYLGVLSLVLWFSLVFFSSWVGGLSSFYIMVSVFFSLLSYFCVHGLFFWVFYEFSILPLLFLLIVESPYSERYVASWYLLGYVVLTSLPMLLCFVYISLSVGSFDLGLWGCSGIGVGVLSVLGVLFITKIPLPPFHVWLPIVHAEATSPVSVCLSGYIMKLGILGVVRFCSRFLPDYIFSSAYLCVGLSLAALFFFSAMRELDGKRWLAFLSLSHIMIGATGLCVSGFESSWLALIYCLGHGFSAGVMFIFLWVVYEVAGTRNWGLLKVGLGSSLLIRCLSGACLCTAASLPPTLQFFCEVFVLAEAGFFGLIFFFLLGVYLFLGGLVPLFFLGGVLTRHSSIGYSGSLVGSGWPSVFFLVLWSFLLFLVI